MGVFEGDEKEKYDVIASLVVLSRNSTFLDEGANHIDLLNHGGFNGIQYLVDRGYATRTEREVSKNLKADHYKLTDKGRKLLEEILEFVDLD